MYRQYVAGRAKARTLLLAALVLLSLACWFALVAIATPFDHDESQYVAGAYFSSRLIIFRDFLYLQPPVHSWVYAPLAWLFPAHMVLAMRLATALTALATLAAIWSAQRIAGVSRQSAAIATLLAAAAAAFQFTAGVVRNDMLPTLLSSAGMFVTLLALRHCGSRYWLSAGALFGLAIATKLNFAPLGLTVGLFVITSGGRCGIKAACWLALGAVAGMGPMLIGWLIAPDAFTFGVLTYGATAPHAWYAANGAVDELESLEKLTDLLKWLWRGPCLFALLLLAVNWIATRGHVRSPGRRLAIWMTIGALIGAALPTPSQLQYVMPLLPPLALALGYLLDDARHWRSGRRRLLLGLLALSSIPGMVEASGNMIDLARNGSPVLEAGEAARWAGRTVRAMTADDDIATLSPHLVLDSGLDLDPRFAAGPFVYRTGWMISTAQARHLGTMTPATIADMDKDMPAAILTGYEDGTRKLPLRPDDSLIAYARRRAYRLVPMPDGIGQLYVRITRSPQRKRMSR